jgi:hypothetical protein
MTVLFTDRFEGDFIYHNDEGQLMVPRGWIPMWLEEPSKPSGHIRPEYRIEYDRTHDGAQAAKWATRHNTHDAVLARTMSVPNRNVVTFTAWGAAFEIMAGQSLRIGINATGSGDWDESEITWSPWFGQDQKPDWKPETFYLYRVSATPQLNQITVFLHSRARFAKENMVAYWDDVLVEQDEGGSPPGGGDVDYERIEEIVQRVVRQALDATTWGVTSKTLYLK